MNSRRLRQRVDLPIRRGRSAFPNAALITPRRVSLRFTAYPDQRSERWWVAMARVLVVDDDKLFSALMRRALEQRGHHVVLTEDAKSGRSALAAEEFDAIVCDIVLPDETGLHVLRDVRASYPAMATIAISGGKAGGRSVHIDVLHLAQTLGTDAVVKKPFELSNFVATVESTCLKKRASNTAASA